MKTFFSSTRGRFATTLALVMALVACGGGGGGGSTPTPTPTPTTVTVTCPDGTTQTAESATVANTACPAPTLVSSTPSNGSLSVSPLAVATDGIVIVTSSVLESLPTTVSLNDGSTDLAGVITAVNTKSIKFVPTATLLYGHVYTLVTTVRDNVGKPLTVNISFTTVNISCPTPQVPSVNGQSCVDPVVAWWPPTFVPKGTTVYLDTARAPAGAVVAGTSPGETLSGLLPSASTTVGDAGWQDAVRNGTIKFITTDARDPTVPSKPIVFAFYRTVSTILFPGQNKVLYCVRPLLAEDGTYGTPDVVENHCSQSEAVSSVGNVLGTVTLYIENGVNVCYQKKFDQNLNGWTEAQVPCP